MTDTVLFIPFRQFQIDASAMEDPVAIERTNDTLTEL